MSLNSYSSNQKNKKLSKYDEIYSGGMSKWSLFKETDVCMIAIMNGWVDLLIWALDEFKEKEKEKDNNLCYYAIQFGQFEILKYLYEKGYTLNKAACDALVLSNNLDILEWFMETLQNENKQIPWDETTCYLASISGNLNILKFLRANGCMWNEETCSMAALNGHLDVLKWARDNNCNWDHNTCTNAAQNGHFEVLKWAKHNGCSLHEDTCKYAIGNNQLEIAKWLKDNGCVCGGNYHK